MKKLLGFVLALMVVSGVFLFSGGEQAFGASPSTAKPKQHKKWRHHRHHHRRHHKMHKHN